MCARYSRHLFAIGVMLGAWAVQPRAKMAPGNAFGRYAAGDFAVVEGLDPLAFDDSSREVKDSHLSPRLKAAFLLEVFESFQRRSQLDVADAATGAARHRVIARALGEGQDALSRLPAGDEFLDYWFRAALAAVAHGSFEQSQAEWSVLSPGGFVPRAASARVRESALNELRIDGHVDAGELALTRILPVEQLAWRFLDERRQTLVTAQQDAFKKVAEQQLFKPLLTGEKEAVPQTLAELKEAEAFESARAESLMRQGALLGASGSPESAVPYLQESERLSRDVWVTYLSRLFEGRAFEAQDRAQAAEASYRAALVLRPKARSANLALAALLFAHGVRADSNLLAVFDSGADRIDPWAQLTFGAYRFWTERRDAMRRLMK